MWTKTGQWRPQDYSLHYTHNNISARPTDEEKINFIDNLFNTILERSKSKGNFSDLRAEIVDHYVTELGDDFHVERGDLFRQKVYEYHEVFGGSERIHQIAKNFYRTKQRMIKWQFLKWFARYWMVHLAFIPFAFMIYLNTQANHVFAAAIVLMFSIAIYEVIKVYSSEDIIKQSRTGDSSVNFFYQYKNELCTGIFGPIYLYNIDHNVTTAESLVIFLTILFIYIQGWIYYYHLNICQRRVAPLLDQYKTQLI